MRIQCYKFTRGLCWSRGRVEGMELGEKGTERRQTHEHAGSRRIPTRDFLGQVRLTSIANIIPPLRILQPQIDQPVQIPSMAPPLFK